MRTYGKSKRMFRKRKDKTLPKNKKDSNQDKRLDKVEKKIRSLDAGEELKYFEVSFTNNTATVAGTRTLLNGMAQGNTQITRIGGQILMTSVHVNFEAHTQTSNLTPQVGRLMIVLDRQANNANPTVTADPLVAGTSAILNSGTVASNSQTFRQLESVKRFKILKDFIFCFNPMFSINNPAAGTDLTTVVALKREIRWNIKLNHVAKYTLAAAGIASISTNALFIIWMTDQASNEPQLTGGTRVYFKDA